MPGILSTLGSWGRGLISRAQQTGRSLGETLGILERHEIIIEAEPAARDWGLVSTADALTPDVSAIRDYDYVPHNLFVESEIPWREKFAYQVTIYGRDAGIEDPKHRGRFRHQAFDMTVSREMTVQEVKDAALIRFGGYEGAKMMEIFDVAVTGAWKSAEVEW